MGHGSDMQRYKGEADGGGQLVAGLHVVTDGCGWWSSWWLSWPREEGLSEFLVVFAFQLNFSHDS